MPLTVAIAIGQLNRKAGPSVNGVRLARALGERGCEAHIVHCTPSGAVDEELAQDMCRQLVRLPYVHPLDPRWGLSFARQMRRLRPDVVHVNTQTQALILAPAAKLVGASTLYTMRNLVEYNAGWIQRGLKVVGPRFIDRFVGVSAAIARNIREHHLARVPARVIYNGVESASREQLAEWRHQTREALGIPQDQLVVGTCGRLSPDKQQHHLLEAARLLRDRDFRMVIVGDGEMRQPLMAFCDEHGLTNVIFTGWQPEVYRFLAAMDVFAFHSMPHSEGLPTVVTEAAMAGLPLVLADIECLREVYADGQQALFARPAQPQDFASHLATLLSSPALRQRLGADASAVAMQQFSIDVMAERYLELYEEFTA